jgi:hypothetical protein
MAAAAAGGQLCSRLAQVCLQTEHAFDVNKHQNMPRLSVLVLNVSKGVRGTRRGGSTSEWPSLVRFLFAARVHNHTTQHHAHHPHRRLRAGRDGGLEDADEGEEDEGEEDDGGGGGGAGDIAGLLQGLSGPDAQAMLQRLMQSGGLQQLMAGGRMG